MVGNGTVAVELSNQLAKLTIRNTVKTKEGQAKETNIVHNNQSLPQNILQKRAVQYPLTLLRRIKKQYSVDISPPLYQGENKPMHANISKKNVIANICTPVPTNMDNIIAYLGFLNTSPFTFFHAISSNTNSSSFLGSESGLSRDLDSSWLI